MKAEIINGNCFEIAPEIIAQKKQEGERVACLPQRRNWMHRH